MWLINVHLRLLKVTVEFVWWGGVGFAKPFSYPTQLQLRLRNSCVVVGVVTTTNTLQT